MPTVSHNGRSFSGSARKFQLPPFKHIETSIWHPTPFTNKFQRPARTCWIIMVKNGSSRHWFLGINKAIFLSLKVSLLCVCWRVSGVSTHSGLFLPIVEKVNPNTPNIKIYWHSSSLPSNAKVNKHTLLKAASYQCSVQAQ
jgi:hypothetical protein